MIMTCIHCVISFLSVLVQHKDIANNMVLVNYETETKHETPLKRHCHAPPQKVLPDDFQAQESNHSWKIMLIDDSSILVGLTKILLERRGHHVFTATCEADALHILQTQPLDLVLILETAICRMNVLQVIRDFRAWQGNQCVEMEDSGNVYSDPVVVGLSEVLDSNFESVALEAGVDEVYLQRFSLSLFEYISEGVFVKSIERYQYPSEAF